MVGHFREVHPLSEASPQLALGYEEMEGELASFPLLGEGSLKVGPVQGEELVASMQEVMSQSMGDELSEVPGIGDGVLDPDVTSNDDLLNPALQGKTGQFQVLSIQDRVQVYGGGDFVSISDMGSSLGCLRHGSARFRPCGGPIWAEDPMLIK